MTSISKTTLDFLNELKLNNNREWFNDHKTEFQKEQKKAKDFYNAILALLNQLKVGVSQKIPGLLFKDIVISTFVLGFRRYIFVLRHHSMNRSVGFPGCREWIKGTKCNAKNLCR